MEVPGAAAPVSQRVTRRDPTGSGTDALPLGASQASLCDFSRGVQPCLLHETGIVSTALPETWDSSRKSVTRAGVLGTSQFIGSCSGERWPGDPQMHCWHQKRGRSYWGPCPVRCGSLKLLQVLAAEVEEVSAPGHTWRMSVWEHERRMEFSDSAC